MIDNNSLFIFDAAKRFDSQVADWLCQEPVKLYSIARHWFVRFRKCGGDVREIMHDGCPTACVNNAAFGYVNVFKSHVNVGFYTGAALCDPQNLLEGTGKRMRHVKIRPGEQVHVQALEALIISAYFDVKARL